MVEPIEVHVVLKTDDEIIRLRAEKAALEARLAEMTAMRDRAEYQFRCECVVNQQLVDLCRASGVKFRPALKDRPW